MEYLQIRLSSFPKCSAAEPNGETTPEKELQDIKNGKHKKAIEIYRKLLLSDPAKAVTYKKHHLQAVTPSGIFDVRKNDRLVVPSGTIGLDVDNVPDDERKRLKKVMAKDRHVIAVWISPGGKGLKILMRMDFGWSAEAYKFRYLQALRYYAERYNIPVYKENGAEWGLDTSCSDISRMCITSYDPAIIINNNAVVFNDFKEYAPNEQRVRALIEACTADAIDITKNYDDWISIGWALVYEYGEYGRSYFHQISRFFTKYTEEECNKKYNELLANPPKQVTIKKLFSIAYKLGITVAQPEGRTYSQENNTISSSDFDIHTPDEREFSIAFKEFPIHLFPKEIRDYILEGTVSLGCIVDLVAVSVLAVVAAAIGNTRAICAPNGHTEYANLFVAVVAEPGAKKSPALRLAKYPIDLMQQKAFDEYERDKEKYKEELAVWEITDKDERGDKPIEPFLKHYSVGCYTMEAFMMILKRNKRGVIIIADELQALFESMNAYRKGDDRQKMLSLWSREAIMVDRKSQETILIKAPFVCIIGGIQMKMLKLFYSKSNDGFYERLLTVLADRKMEFSESSISKETKSAYYQLISDLYAYEAPIRHTDEGEAIKEGEDPNAIIPFQMNNEAKALWTEWNKQHIRDMQDPLFPHYLLGIWSKLQGHTLRFALIFHCLNARQHGSYPMVTADDMNAAFELADYFKYHSYKVTEICNEDDMDVKVREVVRHAKANNEGGDRHGTVTARFVYRNKVGRCANRTDAKKLFDELVNRGLGKVEQAGRSLIFRLDPQYLQ